MKTALPSRFPALAALALLPSLSLAAAPAPLPNTVSGRVVDERGKPVPGVQIIIEPVMFRGTVFTTTDAQGRYQSIELNPAANPYAVTAYKAIKYHDRKYCLRMAGDPEPYREAFNAKAGAVRNFVWRVRGDSDTPDADYGGDTWGGTVAFENTFTDDDRFVDPSSKVEVTFVPDGPLMDGIAGATVKRTVTLSKGVGGVPAGAYRVSAVLLGADGARAPLRVATGNREGDLGATADLLFDGFDGCGHSGTLRATHLWLARP